MGPDALFNLENFVPLKHDPSGQDGKPFLLDHAVGVVFLSNILAQRTNGEDKISRNNVTFSDDRKVLFFRITIVMLCMAKSKGKVRSTLQKRH